MHLDRRRIGQGAPLLLSIMFTLGELAAASPVSAQGFGWGYYRAPSVSRRRPPRRAVPSQTEPGRAPRGTGAEQAPLPVPRPRFPFDPPSSPDEAPAPLPEPPPAPKPVEPKAGHSVAPPAATKVPAPPPQPTGPAPKPPGEVPTPPVGETTKPAQVPPPAADAAPKVPGSGAPPPPVSDAPVPPAKPPELATPAQPGVAPSGARLGEQPGQPADDPGCVDRLKARNVAAEPIDIGPQPDARCTVVHAVRLSGLTLPDGGKVEFPERPTIACTTADSFSLYVRDLLSPLAKGTYGASVAKVWTGPGLECRSRDHILGAKLSAHGQGLAIDIAQVKLANGLMFEVGQPKTETDKNFETAARAAGCGYFHTALGPGTDDYHRTHWHFDLEVRGSKGDSKYCK